jgi:hypothetical protein
VFLPSRTLEEGNTILRRAGGIFNYFSGHGRGLAGGWVFDFEKNAENDCGLSNQGYMLLSPGRQMETPA